MVIMITGASCAALSFGSSAFALSWKRLPGVISKGSKGGKGGAGKGGKDGKGSKGGKAAGKGKGNGKGKSPATGSVRVVSRHVALKPRREPRQCTPARTARPCSKPAFWNFRPGCLSIPARSGQSSKLQLSQQLLRSSQ